MIIDDMPWHRSSSDKTTLQSLQGPMELFLVIHAEITYLQSSKQTNNVDYSHDT